MTWKPGAFCSRRPWRTNISARALPRGVVRSIQLTWLAHIAFVYDRFSFRLLRTFHYDGEGWGLTQDGRNLILSDGTASLRFFDPQTFREVRRIVVKDQGAPVTQLNELEYVAVRFMPTSGTPTASPAFRRPPAACSGGSTSADS